MMHHRPFGPKFVCVPRLIPEVVRDLNPINTYLVPLLGLSRRQRRPAIPRGEEKSMSGVRRLPATARRDAENPNRARAVPRDDYSNSFGRVLGRGPRPFGRHTRHGVNLGSLFALAKRTPAPPSATMDGCGAQLIHRYPIFAIFLSTACEGARGRLESLSPDRHQH
jgi:hypothetical protein